MSPIRYPETPQPKSPLHAGNSLMTSQPHMLRPTKGVQYHTACQKRKRKLMFTLSYLAYIHLKFFLGIILSILSSAYHLKDFRILSKRAVVVKDAIESNAWQPSTNSLLK